MDKTIEKRALKNSLIGALSFVLVMIQTIVSVPVLLNYWGKEEYGVWLALFAGFTMLQTMDSGHQNYVGNKFNILYHSNRNELMDTLGSSILISYLLGLLEIIVCCVLIFSRYLPKFLGITSETALHYQTSVGFIVLGTMWLLVGSIGGIMSRLLIPIGMMFESICWGIAIRAVQFLSLIAVAVFGGSILTACVSYAAIQMIFSGLLFLYVKNKLPEFYPWWQKRSWRTAFSNFSKSLILTVNGIAQQLSNNGLIIFIATMFQATIVPAFTTVRTLTNTAGSVTNILISAVSPDLIRFHAKGETDKLKTTLSANWFFSGLLVNFGIVLILPFVQSLYVYWTRGRLEFNLGLFLFLAGSISFANFGSGLNTYLAGINNLSAQVSITMVRVLIIFGVSLLSAARFGLVGVGIAILVSEMVCSVFMPLYFVKAQLKTLGDTLDLRTIIIPLASPIIISIIAVVYFYAQSIRFLIPVSVVLLSVVYFAEWTELNQEIKTRFWRLMVSFRAVLG